MSRQLGLQLLAQGAYAGIRNVAAHADTPWAEYEAIEELAVLSVIARWPKRPNHVFASELRRLSGFGAPETATLRGVPRVVHGNL